MDIKQSVIKELEECRGQSISGSYLAAKLNVTRSAIWKAVKALQKDGYMIDAATNRGYLLRPDNDILSEESIRPLLKGEAISFILDVRSTVTSTNTVAKALALEGVPHGTVVIAAEQTSGRGRMGRSFYSPPNTGIYLTLILRPDLKPEDSLLITTCSAVAAARAIESIANVRADIKWVNDILVKGKKVCGILTEASLNFESGRLEYAVVGIGVNITTRDFPDGLNSTAGAVLAEKPSDIPICSALAAEVLNNMAECMNSLTDRQWLDEYRKRSFLIGKEILVLKGNDKLAATAIGIDDKAGLIVRYDDESTETLSCGEVSVRPLPDTTSYFDQ